LFLTYYFRVWVFDCLTLLLVMYIKNKVCHKWLHFVRWKSIIRFNRLNVQVRNRFSVFILIYIYVPTSLNQLFWPTKWSKKCAIFQAKWQACNPSTQVKTSPWCLPSPYGHLHMTASTLWICLYWYTYNRDIMFYVSILSTVVDSGGGLTILYF